MASFVDTLRPEKFSGAYFKRWSVKVMDWLTAIKIFWVKDGLPKENISDEDMRKFQEASDIFVGAVRDVLLDHLFDSMMHIRDAKAMWDHLNATYSASYALLLNCLLSRGISPQVSKTRDRKYQLKI
jgi:hypothetical protein